MRRIVPIAALAALAACGGGSDKSTGPAPLGTPVLTQVNGVTAPSGLPGMTVILEGTQLGDSARGTVYFLGSGGTRIAAAAARADWTSTFIVATVPSGIADSSRVWVETTGGVSDSLRFRLLAGGTFSPSNITWAQATALPSARQGLGAAFVSVDWGSAKSRRVFAIGGADTANAPSDSVWAATIQGSGATLGAWTPASRLTTHRAYLAVAVATPSTAPIDTLTPAYVYAIGGVDVADGSSTVGSVEVARVGLDGQLGPFTITRSLPLPVHGASATVFRGYLFVAGGAGINNAARANVWRAKIGADGSLGIWEAQPALPHPAQFGALANLGPYLYYVGGDSGTVAPATATMSGNESSNVYLARVNVRDGVIPSWTSTTSMGKARSKEGAVVAGGSLFTTSGLYSGAAGSSENSYATLNADGTLASWNGATGTNTLVTLLGYSLYNQATLTFADANGTGHVMVLGGAKRGGASGASSAVAYY